jgi:hypothetical protein
VFMGGAPFGLGGGGGWGGVFEIRMQRLSRPRVAADLKPTGPSDIFGTNLRPLVSIGMARKASAVLQLEPGSGIVWA